MVIEGKSCVLALLRSNTTFRLISIKPFHIRDIKVSSKDPKHDPKYYNKSKGQGNAGIIPPAILAISLKRNRE